MEGRLLSKMGKMGVPAHVSLWVKNFLTDRRARVRWNHSTSKWRVFREGLPQGSVLTSLLWVTYINDIDQNINSETVWSLFADDVTLLATGTSLNECGAKLQPALDAEASWGV